MRLDPFRENGARLFGHFPSATYLRIIGSMSPTQNLGGGGFAALARHGTAALLSSVAVNYKYNATQVLNGVRAAFMSGPPADPNLVTGPFSGGVLNDLAAANELDESACPAK